MEKKNFLFSIVSAVYNCEEYLDEMIGSILSQSIGFKENVQLILVNDGSSDGSLAVCEKYRDQYPENIIVVDKKNGGVSSARNAGIPYATGKYLNFTDSDDILSDNTLEEIHRAFTCWGDDTDVINIPFRYFDGAEGGEDHIQNQKFNRGKRVVNLDSEYKVSIMNVTFSFIRASAAEGLLFDETISVGEDLKYINTVLLKKRTVGLIDTCTYFYRKHSNGSVSIIAGKLFKKEYYIPQLKGLTLWARDYCMREFGEYPLFLQYTIACDFQEKVRQTQYFKEMLGDELDEYRRLMDEAFLTFDDIIVKELALISGEYRVFWLRKKYGRYPNVQYFREKLSYSYPAGLDEEGEQISTVIDWRGYSVISALEYNGEQIRIKGHITLLPYSEDTSNIKIYVRLYNHLFEARIRENDNRCLYLDEETVYERKYYEISIPVADVPESAITVWYGESPEKLTMIQYLGFDKFAPLSLNDGGKVAVMGGAVFTAEQSSILLEMKGKKYAKAAWRRHLRSLRSTNRKYYYYRKIVSLARPFLGKKKIWLISDRHDTAGDNGEAFFSYLCKTKPKGIKPIFVIDRASPDYARLKKLGAVVAYGSKLHKLYYVMADANVSAHFDDKTLFPVEYDYFRDVVSRKKAVFLQHGVTKDDIHNVYSKYKQNTSLFVCASDKERDSIALNENYGFEPNEVLSTGFARFDNLSDTEQRVITVMPTWRKYLFSGMGADGKWMIRKNVENSEFFRFYSALLSSEELAEAAKKYGYRLVFAPHINLVPLLDKIKIGESFEVLAHPINYNRIFADSALMVTDYSSTAFDFAYMRKPLVYAQFDKDFFFSSHSYKQGYFSYEDNGFGEVTTDVESTVQTIIEYMARDCAPKDKYLERVEEFFTHNDKNNCERIMRAIENMEDRDIVKETPMPDKRHIPVVLATNDKYVPFVSVTIASLLYNSDLRNYYDIYVLNSGLTEENKKALECTTKNHFVRCIDVSSAIEPHLESLKEMSGYISKETYYRLVIPSLLPQYDKVIYIDCDLVVLGDLAEMYDHDVEGYLIGGVRNPLHTAMKEHIELELELDARKYVNAGVLLMNTAKMREDGFEDKCFELLASGRRLRFMDQDVINLICKDSIKYLDMSWNYEWHYERLNNFKDTRYHLIEGETEEYEKAAESIKILHYTGDVKPWNNSKPRFGGIFWEYAKLTPFYNDILLASPLNPTYRRYLEATAELERVKGSFSYKIGRFITLPARAVRRIYRTVFNKW